MEDSRSSVAVPAGQKKPGGQATAGCGRPNSEQTKPAGQSSGSSMPQRGQACPGGQSVQLPCWRSGVYVPGAQGRGLTLPVSGQ
jgi:hypothetical protein